MTTETLTLSDFLLARIAEDEQAVQRGQARHLRWLASLSGPAAIAIPWFNFDRLFAECEAKRRIIREYQGEVGRGPAGEREDFVARHGGILDAYSVALRALAAVYADHPEFREEWR